MAKLFERKENPPTSEFMTPGSHVCLVPVHASATWKLQQICLTSSYTLIFAAMLDFCFFFSLILGLFLVFFNLFCYFLTQAIHEERPKDDNIH